MTMKIYLKKSDLVTVLRYQRGELNRNLTSDKNASEMTVDEAIKYGAWDTCAGTMTAKIRLANPQAFSADRGVELSGNDVFFNNGKVFVLALDDWQIEQRKREQKQQAERDAHYNEMVRAGYYNHD
jgi:hypothetical protein